MHEMINAWAKEWERESEMTSGLLDTIDDASLTQPTVAGRRTLGGIAWHLVSSLQFMRTLGLTFEAVEDSPEIRQSSARIADAYRRTSERFLEALKTQWTDANLDDTVQIAGEQWKNGDSLRYSLMHQAHHRGQMTVLMRQAGLRPPGLYGPTYETWVEQGMAPLE
ncbi:DinB family protein [Cohnella sp. 56]|uniref:DinB family protein n=1 Tax=Cohnella sp. 56 TaxID=3113722 RepID=UPI0030E7B339